MVISNVSYAVDVIQPSYRILHTAYVLFTERQARLAPSSRLLYWLEKGAERERSERFLMQTIIL